MKLRKILLKRFIITAGVSILLTAVLSTAAFWFIFSSSEKTTIKNYANIVTNLYNKSPSYEQLHDLTSSRIRITLLDSKGNVLLESEDGVDITKMENHSNRPEFIKAMKNGYGDDSRMSETIGRVTYYYAIKTDNGNVLRVSESMENGYSIFMHLVPILLGVVILIFIFCYLLSIRSTKKIIAPIENLESNVDGTQYEELSSISRTISSQQQQISKQVSRLQLEKDRIDTLIQNMSEGFIMLDMDKNMLMCNHSASKYLGTDSEGTVGESLISFSRNEILCECVDKAFSGERSSNEGSINGRILQIIASPVYSNSEQKGVICLIIDVSAKRKAEKMRREFTANVTHELKTPLTSISGYAEIIESGIVAPEDIERFAGKIHKESGRLLSLIGDIIELSELDENTTPVNYDKVDLCGLSREVAEDLHTNANKHDVVIKVIADEKILINGNRNQIYELVYNLCDNAIRYNKKGGSVTVTVKREDDNAVLSVADTGIGIPLKHQKRVFERFYRVDKSRSKETGGTGLGLAIVKHIAERHNGTITLKSNESGTTFTFKVKAL
ncbi:ATP-binding protein [Ruminococcus sp.]|uniref:sensor histidine kinase n=1 Tax=Ruminococcus sp. TaxID=41978 RepID=UPI00386DFEAE